MRHTLVDRKCDKHGNHLRLYKRLKKGRMYVYHICPKCEKEKLIKRTNEKRIAKQIDTSVLEAR